MFLSGAEVGDGEVPPVAVVVVVATAVGQMNSV